MPDPDIPPPHDLRPGDAVPPTVIAPDSAGAADPVPGEIVDGPGGPRLFGRYRLVQELGRGAMGVVWKAWDTQLSRTVALKAMRQDGALDLDQVERFQREARLAAKVVHPNVVRVLDVGEHEGQRYLTSEYVEATPLDVMMERPVPLDQAIAWVKGIAEALACAHEQGVIHRDVKPGNVLIDAGNRPHVTDFGLAKEVAIGGVSPLAEKLTLSGVLLGTPSYMSPEQAEGQVSTLGPATDQFSLGVVFYELLTGEMPFAGSGLHELLNAIIEGDPVPPSRRGRPVPPDLEAICLRMLEKSPARRYASLRAFLADIQRYLAGESTLARPMSFLTRIARRAAKRQAVILPIAAVVIVAAGIAFGLWRWRGKDVQRADIARDEAKAGQAAAERTLAKARLVARVLQRWNGIADAISDLERAHFDTRAGKAGVADAIKRSWPAIEAFERETPDDPASRATTTALGGWARFLAGREEEGIVAMREAARIDADVPYGRLMEALVCLLRYLDHEPALRVDLDRKDVVFDIDAESPDVAAALAPVDGLVAGIRGAAVWGAEGAQGFSGVLAGIAALRAKTYPQAEAELTKAIGVVDLRTFETILRLIRARTRLLQLRLPEAIEDLDAVIRAWPGHATPYVMRGVAEDQMAQEAKARKEDSRSLLEKALADFDAALAHGAPPADLRSTRASAWLLLAEARFDLGGDVDEAFARAEADWAWALGNAPTTWHLPFSLGLVRFRMAQRLARKGKDPTAKYLSAIADLDAAVAGAGADPRVLDLRAICLYELGEEERDAGIDPRPRYAKAMADLDAAIAADGAYGPARSDRGFLHLLIASAEKAHGGDGAASIERALPDLDEAVARMPGDVEARRHRGLARLLKAERIAAQGDDAREAYRLAIEDLEKAVAAEPEDGEGLYYCGVSRRGHAEAEAHQGGADPRVELGRAIEDLSKSVERLPSNRLSWAALVKTRIMLAEDVEPPSEEEYARAMADCGRALAVDAKNHQVLVLRGQLHEVAGDAAAAVADYEEVARLVGDTPPWLADLLARAREAAKPR